MERNAFNHFQNWWKIKQKLTDKQYVEFDKALCRVQFLECHVDDIVFEDTTLELVWEAMKYTLKQSLEGYFAKKDITYDEYFKNARSAENTGIDAASNTPSEPPADTPSDTPCHTPLDAPTDTPTEGGQGGGYDAPCQAPCQQEKEKEKEQEKGKEKGGECERGKESQSQLATRNKFSRNKDSPYLEDAKEVAEYLAERIKRFNPNAKPKPKGWIRDIDLAMRIDGRSKEELLRCIDWIYETPEGSFWIPNILSGKKLREKFDTMQLQAQRSGHKKPLAVLNELHEEGWM